MYQITTTEELDSCPFCGRHYACMWKDHPTDFYFFVKCACCGARTQAEQSEKEAARRWNMRGRTR